jgi:hypothetical protein
MSNMIQSALDYVPQLDDDDDDDQKSLSMFTDGLIPCYFDESITKKIDYDHLLERIKFNIKSKQDYLTMHGQIDGIVDNDDDERDTKSFVKKREFFVHSTSNNGYSPVSQLNIIDKEKIVE